MLGALEIKALARVIREAQGKGWKPVHSAVIACLLAHRSRHGISWPQRSTIAAFAGVSEKTVTRVINDLSEWGLVERQQPRALTSGQVRNAQYAFLFPLPPRDDFAPAAGQNDPSPRDNFEGAIRNRSLKDLKPEDRREEPAPKNKCVQRDFDERDWRRLSRELDLLRQASVGSCEARDDEQIFALGCRRAGISVRRGQEVIERMAG